MWIEIFKAGEHKDSSGRSETFTPERLGEIAEIYNKRALSDDSLAAPLVKGHPKTNDPAFGWIDKLSRSGSRLLAKIRDISPELGAEVRRGMFKKVSISLYPDMMLRHVGLLGAFPPAVKGLKPLNFAESEGNLEFSMDRAGSAEAELSAENEELLQRQAELYKELEGEREKIRESELKDFLTRIESKGALNPAQIEELRKAILLAREIEKESGGKPLESALREFAESMEPPLDLREYTASRAAAVDDFNGRNVNAGRLGIHRRAKEEMQKNPGMEYEEALSRISNNL